MNLKKHEIIERLAEIKELLSGDDDVDIEALETEVRELEEQLAQIEKRKQIADSIAEQKPEKRDYNPQTIPKGVDDPTEFKSLGEFIQTVAHNPKDKRLKDRHVESRQQSQSVGTEGGVLVPDQFAQTLLTVSPDEAIIRPRARVFGGGTGENFGELHIPAIQYSGENMYGGAVVDWIDEGDVKPETDVTFKRVTLHPFEVAAHVQVTDRLLSNAPVIGQIVSTQLRGALIDAEENAFLTGNGAARPTGIIDHAATISIARAGAGLVQYDDVAAMFAQFRGRSGVWITGRDVLPQLMAMVDENDNFVWQPNARDGIPGNIFGMPVLFSDHSPALGLQGDIVLADLSYYLIGDGMGLSIAVSPHQLFTSNKTIIKAWKTVDGVPWLTGPLPTNVPTSPFIELDA